MKNFVKLGASAALACAAFTGAAMADEGTAKGGWYVSGGIGYNAVDDVDGSGVSIEFEDGYTILGAIGYDTGDITSYGKFRIEAEISYTENDNDNATVGGVTANLGGSLDQTGFMVNSYLDFVPGGTLRPYLGVGLGFVDAEMDVTLGAARAAADGTEFAYRGLAGLSWHLDDNWALDLGYRYTVWDEADNHAVVTGIRYGF